jgi:hypothetical protein
MSDHTKYAAMELGVIYGRDADCLAENHRDRVPTLYSEDNGGWSFEWDYIDGRRYRVIVQHMPEEDTL